MWKKINTEKELKDFLENVKFFHDSCIKELKYVSGAYVSEDLSMYPVNKLRSLRLIIQCQFEECPMIEMEFVGLKQLQLFPEDENYTCEILDATMFFKDSCIYWCGCGDMVMEDIDNYSGTLICASKFQWRKINGCMGEEEFYVPNK